MTPTKNDTNSRVDRGGGCWNNNAAWWVRPASRYTHEPADRDRHIGFRTSLPSRQPNTHTRERTHTA